MSSNSCRFSLYNSFSPGRPNRLNLRVLQSSGKNAVLWKPIFVAVGLAMVVMVIRALVNLAAAATLQTSYYPFDISLGVRFDQFATLYFPPEAVNSLSVASQNAFPIINSATSAFRGIVTVMAFISYIWLGALSVYALSAVKPEFSLGKRITLVSCRLRHNDISSTPAGRSSLDTKQAFATYFCNPFIVSNIYMSESGKPLTKARSELNWLQ